MASITVTPGLVVAAGAVWPPVCLAIVALRFHSRKAADLGYSIDDWLILPALVLLFGMCASLICGVALRSIAYPLPETDLEEELYGIRYSQTITRKLCYVVQLMLALGLGCSKLSFMFLFRRIFCAGTGLVFHLASWIWIVVLVAWTVAFTFLMIFTCGTHFDNWWTSVANGLQCVDPVAVQDSYAATDVVTDAVIMVFPLPLVWKLQMSLRRKLAVTAMFLLGALALAASVTRLVIYAQVVSAETSAHPPDADMLTSAGMYFMIIELALAICAACLPCMGGLRASKRLRTIFGSLSAFFTTRSGSTPQDKTVHVQSKSV